MIANAVVTEKGNQLGAGSQSSYRVSCLSPRFRALMRAKRAVAGSLLIISLGFFSCMTLLAGYARPFMTSKLFGALNVGFFLILLAYVLCWLTALLYIRAANGSFDREAEVLIAEHHARSIP